MSNQNTNNKKNSSSKSTWTWNTRATSVNGLSSTVTMSGNGTTYSISQNHGTLLIPDTTQFDSKSEEVDEDEICWKGRSIYDIMRELSIRQQVMEDILIKGKTLEKALLKYSVSPKKATREIAKKVHKKLKNDLQ